MQNNMKLFRWKTDGNAMPELEPWTESTIPTKVILLFSFSLYFSFSFIVSLSHNLSLSISLQEFSNSQFCFVLWRSFSFSSFFHFFLPFFPPLSLFFPSFSPLFLSFSQYNLFLATLHSAKWLEGKALLKRKNQKQSSLTQSYKIWITIQCQKANSEALLYSYWWL